MLTRDVVPGPYASTTAYCHHCGSPTVPAPGEERLDGVVLCIGCEAAPTRCTCTPVQTQ